MFVLCKEKVAYFPLEKKLEIYLLFTNIIESLQDLTFPMDNFNFVWGVSTFSQSSEPGPY